MHRVGWARRLVVFDRLKLRIVAVAIPRRLESQHLLITGGTGAGKSQTLYGLLDTLRKRGEPAILTDTGAEALYYFGRPTDRLLNPLDQRSVDWSPFAEMSGPADAERLAKSMVPDPEGDRERQWAQYSQALIAAALKRLWAQGQTTNGALLDTLVLASNEQLEALVQGLPVQRIFHPGAEKMLGSVLGIIGAHFAPYSYLSRAAGAKSWSIRRYVREGKGWLWLSYREEHAAALKPLLATWVGEAVNATLSLPADRARRRYLILDEAASLGRVQSLGDALTKGRKYGLCAILGVQSIAQLREVYGKDGAQVLLACLSSLLLMRAIDPETAEYGSLQLGECEVLRESVARGKDRTVTQQRHVERLVMPSEIQGLPDMVGDVRRSGEMAVRRVKIRKINRPQNADSFVPKTPDLKVVPPPSPAPADPKPSRPPLDADAILGQRAQ